MRLDFSKVLSHVLHEAHDWKASGTVCFSTADIEDLEVSNLGQLFLILHMLANDFVKAMGPLELVQIVASWAQSSLKRPLWRNCAQFCPLHKLSFQEFVDTRTLFTIENQGFFKELLDSWWHWVPNIFLKLKRSRVLFITVAASHKHVKNGTDGPDVIECTSIVLAQLWG